MMLRRRKNTRSNASRWFVTRGVSLILALFVSACIDKPGAQHFDPLQDLRPTKFAGQIPPRYLPVRVVNHLDGSTVELDREAIESFGLRNIEVWDPRSRTILDYQGVRFSDVVTAVAGQGVVRIIARSFQGLRINFGFGELLETPYMLVTRENNIPLGLASRGPLRIVVEQDELGAQRNIRLAPKWAWQIVQLDIYGG